MEEKKETKKKKKGKTDKHGNLWEVEVCRGGIWRRLKIFFQL